jgi:hypothetical protein
MATPDNKSLLQQYVNAYRSADFDVMAAAVKTFFTPNATINVVHPFNEHTGSAAYIDEFLQPLTHSFEGLRRSEYIAIGGEFEESRWLACTGYYSGNFVNPWIGIKPTGTLAYLRFAEFHFMTDGKAVESYIFLDIPALMLAAGVWPLKHTVAKHAGYTGYLPGPATQDGLVWHNSNPDSTTKTLQLTEKMLLNLATVDEAWRAEWHDDMTWYGPAVFGAFQGKEEFADFQTPFENTFSEWISGIMPGSVTKHFIRMADGEYCCLGGWPSLNMMQVKPFLGQGPTDKRVYMRVCDFWRRDGDLLAENWVFVDALHFLLQLDYDVLQKISNQTA